MRFVIPHILLILLAVSSAASSAAASPPAATTQATFKAWGSSNGNPTTPGYHKLVFEWQENGEAREMPFVLYLPEGYTPDKHWPLMIFLAGMGERGSDPAVVMNCGVPVDLGGRPEVRKWLPMIMLLPLCPSDRTWDSPDMPPKVVSLIRSCMDRWPVDSDRVYVTGLSMGGRGCWALAREAPDLFTVVAPLVSRELDAERTAQMLSKSQTTFLVISGMADGASEPASRQMVDALRKYPVDVVYAPVPRAPHGLWPAYYGSKQFYEWLLMHQKGKGVSAARPSADDMISLYYTDQKGSREFQDKLQAEFSNFAQYWQVDNCAPRPDVVGLKPEMAGRKNVFVTYPLTQEVACRLQLTQQVPVKKATYLRIRAGRHPEGEWELLLRVNELEAIRQPVNKQTAPDGWLEIVYDLTPWGNGEARVQIAHQATGSNHPEAYWSEVAIEIRELWKAPD